EVTDTHRSETHSLLPISFTLSFLHQYHFLLQVLPTNPDQHSFPTRRSSDLSARCRAAPPCASRSSRWPGAPRGYTRARSSPARRSEEHTSELQSRGHLVCRLLLEKKKNASETDQTGVRQHATTETTVNCVKL